MPFVELHCFPEQQQSDHKQYGDGSHADVHPAGKLAHDGNEGRAKDGGAFSADIIEPEVFSRLFHRNDLPEIRT